MIVFFIFSIWLLVLEHTVPHIITHVCINIVSYTQSAKENSSSNWKFGIRSSLTDLGLENSSHTVPRQHQIITILKPCSILEHITQEHAVHQTHRKSNLFHPLNKLLFLQSIIIIDFTIIVLMVQSRLTLNFPHLRKSTHITNLLKKFDILADY